MAVTTYGGTPIAQMLKKSGFMWLLIILVSLVSLLVQREIDEWPPMDCWHIHDPKEWELQELNSVKYWPSKEKAEYTAALAFYIASPVS